MPELADNLYFSEKVENLSKVNMKVHIELITQLVGKIGM